MHPLAGLHEGVELRLPPNVGKRAIPCRVDYRGTYPPGHHEAPNRAHVHLKPVGSSAIRNKFYRKLLDTLAVDEPSGTWFCGLQAAFTNHAWNIVYPDI
jgi:hypothetical protein